MSIALLFRCGSPEKENPKIRRQDFEVAEAQGTISLSNYWIA
jgi:hypothetical protein